MKPYPIELIETRRKYLLFKNDIGVPDAARWGQLYESFIYEFIRKHLHTVIGGTTVIDIGANFGFHTLEFSELVGESGKVHSFEPQKFVFYQLCGNLLLNGCDNVIPHNVALGDVSKVVMMERPDYYSEGKINIGDTHVGLQNAQDRVAEKRLDDYHINNVSVIKIDVQGFEPFVLDGARETILRNKPVIFIEVEPGQLQLYGFTPSDILDRLTALGYTYRKPVDQPSHYDYVAIPLKGAI